MFDPSYIVFRTDNISCLLPSSAIARALAQFTVHGVGASPAVLAALGRRAPPSFDPARLGERCARGSRALERAADLDGPVVPGGRRRQAREAIHEIRPPSVEPSELGLEQRARNRRVHALPGVHALTRCLVRRSAQLLELESCDGNQRGDRGSGARAADVHLVGGSCGCRVNVPAPGSTVIVKRPMKSTPRKPSTVMGGFALTMTGSS